MISKIKGKRGVSFSKLHLLITWFNSFGSFKKYPPSWSLITASSELFFQHVPSCCRFQALHKDYLQSFRSPLSNNPIYFFLLTLLRLLVSLYPQIKYGGGTYYTASGPYSTCLSIPSNLQTIINSIKLGLNVKQCTFYGDGDCTKVKGKYETYRKDQPGTTLSPILTIKCTKD